MIICTAAFHCNYRQLQTNSFNALPYFVVCTDNRRAPDYMHCRFHFIYRHLHTNWIYDMQRFISFTDNCRPIEYIHYHISLYLQTTETKSIYAVPHFIVYTDNCRPKDYMHSHISFYLQTPGDQMYICSATFHCIYKQLQTNWIYALSHFILFTENCRPNQYTHCNISLYLQTTADQHIIRPPTLHFIYRQLQSKWIYALPHFTVFTDYCRPNLHCHISLYLQTNINQINILIATLYFLYKLLQTK